MIRFRRKLSKMSTGSEVWKHFEKNENNAKCNICQRILSCKNSSTSGLIRHLEIIHNILVNKKRLSRENVDVIAKKTVKTTTNIPQQSLEAIVAKLAASDGMSMRTIANSCFLRESIISKGFKLPKNPSGITKLINNFANAVRTEIIKRLSDMKSNGVKFSKSLDEWTSIRNKKFLNVCIFNKDEEFNLGLIRLVGSSPATKILGAIDDHLKKFGIEIECDILCSTSDGAAIMEKYGRLAPFTLQLCYNHAIHLAVIGCLGAKMIRSNKVLEDGIDEDDDDANDDFDVDDIDDESGVSDYGDDELDEENDIDLSEGSIGQMINAIRKIVKLFRKSSIKNDVLQKHVSTELGTQLNLLLDNNTRWNTIITMLERFSKIENCVIKALQDINRIDLWDESYSQQIEYVVKMLIPVKLAVEALSRRDSNLLTAEATLHFLFNTLTEQNNELSLNLLKLLKEKISYRRNKPLVSLMLYLKNIDKFKSRTSDPFFQVSTKTEVIKLAKTIISRCYASGSNQDSDDQINSSSTEQEVNAQSKSQHLAEQLQSFIDESMAEKMPNRLLHNLDKEFKLYEATEAKSNNLNLLFDALLSIKPTSTENERVFSLASTFVSKKRTNLSDETLSDLVFLKSYFKKIDNN